MITLHFTNAQGQADYLYTTVSMVADIVARKSLQGCVAFYGIFE